MWSAREETCRLLALSLVLLLLLALLPFAPFLDLAELLLGRKRSVCREHPLAFQALSLAFPILWQALKLSPARAFPSRCSISSALLLLLPMACLEGGSFCIKQVPLERKRRSWRRSWCAFVQVEKDRHCGGKARDVDPLLPRNAGDNRPRASHLSLHLLQQPGWSQALDPLCVVVPCDNAEGPPLVGLEGQRVQQRSLGDHRPSLPFSGGEQDPLHLLVGEQVRVLGDDQVEWSDRSGNGYVGLALGLKHTEPLLLHLAGHCLLVSLREFKAVKAAALERAEVCA